MNSEGKAPRLHLNLSALAVSRLGGQLKQEVLGPTGLSRPTTRNTMFNFAYHFQC